MIAAMLRSFDDRRARHRFGLMSLCLPALLCMALVNAANAEPAATPAHHRGDRFQNNYLDFEP